MIGKLFLAILSYLVFMNTTSAHELKRKCALAFLEKTKELKITSKTLEVDPNIDLYIRPSFKRVKDCFLGGQYDEIIWISHGVDYGLVNTIHAPVYIWEDGDQIKKIPIYPRFFKKLAQEITESGKKPPNLHVVFCGASTSKATSMQELFKLYEAEDVTLNLKKESIILSSLLQRSVTGLSRRWLNETLNEDFRSRRVNGKWCSHDKSSIQCMRFNR